MQKIKAGTLRYIVVIQRNTTHQDEFGNIVTEWIDIKQTRAAINPIAGDEIIINNQLVNNIDNEIIIRYTDVKPKDRIINNGVIYNIRRVLDFENRKIWQQILAKEDMSIKNIPNLSYPYDLSFPSDSAYPSNRDYDD